jgi:hypothetical protein
MTDVPYNIDEPYQLNDPLEMDDARRASRRVAEIRRDAENEHRRAVQAKADAEREYRQALAIEIVRLKNGGESSTAATERARGEDAVKDKLREFRVAEGMVDAAKERLRGIEGERSLLKSLIDASARMMVGPEARPPDGHVYGEGKPPAVTRRGRVAIYPREWTCVCGTANTDYARVCHSCGEPLEDVFPDEVRS